LTLKLVNTYEKIRDDWYSWTVKIAGTRIELNQIKYVTYILHESFPNRRIVSSNSNNNYARTLEGWGEFLLQAEAQLKNGKKKFALLWVDLGSEFTLDEKNLYNGVFTATKMDPSDLVDRKEPP